jgi:redox-sensitive bicupin YhaK (pirin superfamily)
MVGPFIFFDEMGPATMKSGEVMSVRPHPHINLATVSYLFEGSIMHRDSTGAAQVIEPGAINWMVAGRGIVHSERTPADEVFSERRLHGIQLWVALPTEHEETEPMFHHHPKASLPAWERDGARVRLLLGSALGERSPVPVFSEMLYLDVELQAGARWQLPEAAERAVYMVSGKATIGGSAVTSKSMAVLSTGAAELVASEDSRLMVIGGEPMGERHIWWNFVSSRKERIEEAKTQWRERRFPLVPGDQRERVELPGS